jgi:hypothetical protein
MRRIKAGFMGNLTAHDDTTPGAINLSQASRGKLRMIRLLFAELLPALAIAPRVIEAAITPNTQRGNNVNGV